MKSRTKIIAIIVISILLLILIAVIVYNVVYLPTTREDTQPIDEVEDDVPVATVEHLSVEGRALEFCKENVECGLLPINYYTISTDLNDEILINAINDINTKINNAYQTSLNSTDMSSAECSNVSNLYQRSIIAQSMLTLYGSDELIGITLVSGTSNLCLSTNDQEIDIYYYDIATDRMLTEEEIKTTYSITDEEILTAITNDIDQRNTEENLNYSTNIIDYHIYITSDGILSVYYKQPEDNIYYSVPLDKTV